MLSEFPCLATGYRPESARESGRETPVGKEDLRAIIRPAVVGGLIQSIEGKGMDEEVPRGKRVATEMQTEAREQSQISEFGEIDEIMRNAGRPMHKRSMSEEAIKRVYLKESSDKDEEESGGFAKKQDLMAEPMNIEKELLGFELIRIHPEIVSKDIEFSSSISKPAVPQEKPQKKASVKKIPTNKPSQAQDLPQLSKPSLLLQAVPQEKPEPLQKAKQQQSQPSKPAKTAATRPPSKKKVEPMDQEDIKPQGAKQKSDKDKIKVKVEASQSIQAVDIIGASRVTQKSAKDSKKVNTEKIEGSAPPQKDQIEVRSKSTNSRVQFTPEKSDKEMATENMENVAKGARNVRKEKKQSGPQAQTSKEVTKEKKVTETNLAQGQGDAKKDQGQITKVGTNQSQAKKGTAKQVSSIAEATLQKAVAELGIGSPEPDNQGNIPLLKS